MEKYISILNNNLGKDKVLIKIKQKYYNKDGVLLLLHHYYNKGLQKEWTVSEYYSGFSILNTPKKTMQQAIDHADEVLQSRNINNQKEIIDYLKKHNIELINS